MSRVVGFFVALMLVGVVPVVVRLGQDQDAKGTVKTVAADSVTVTDAAGKDWTFAVDAKTKLIAAVAHTRPPRPRPMGKSPAITDLVKEDGKVSIKYHEMEGGKLHAAEVRVL